MRKRFLINCCLATFLTLLLIVSAGSIAFAQGNRAAAPGEVQIEGVLEILVEDSPTGARTLHFLKSADRRYVLQFPGKPPARLRAGSHVRVRGTQADGTITLTSGYSSVQLLALDLSGTGSTDTVSATGAPTLQNTLGEQRTLVLLVNFQDTATNQPFSVDQARQAVFGAVTDYYREASFGQTWFSGDAYGWFTLPLASTCNTLAIGDAADQAAQAAGINLASYGRLIYIVKQSIGCTWAGVSTYGLYPSKAWINGTLDGMVIAHELGHGLGLAHSNYLDCTDGTLGSICVTAQDDKFDAMGSSPAIGHFNAFQKERLNWFLPGDILTVTASGTYTLQPYELAGGSNPKALKIMKSTDAATGSTTWYYLEYRQALGFDGFISGNTNVLNGVLIHTAVDSDAYSSLLLDMTPNSQPLDGWDRSDPALASAQTFADSNSGVTITTQWANSSTSGVSVSLSRPSCLHANPTVTISPSQSQPTSAGTAVSYTVSVSNNDTLGCAPSTFTLQATVPAGWPAIFAAPALTLSPAVSASTVVTVTSPASVAEGTYPIGVTATNSAYASATASAATSYVIGATRSVTVSTDKQIYTRNQTASVRAKVSAGGTPVMNAAVTFTVTKSNGSVVAGRATTGSDGTATYKLRLRKQDPVGKYQASAVSTGNGQSATASTSFTVQ